jgi:hypothetical protein
MAEHLTVAACERFISAAKGTCAATAAQAPQVAPAHVLEGPNLEPLVTAIGWGSLVIMVVTLVVVALGIVVAVRWGQNVVREAKEEAKREVEKVAPAHVRTYLDERVPGMVAEAVAALNPPGSGTSAEQQQEDLGGEPR